MTTPLVGQPWTSEEPDDRTLDTIATNEAAEEAAEGASASDYLDQSLNLSDLPSASTARTNLGLGTMATQAATGYVGIHENVNTQASVSGTYTIPASTTATMHDLTLTGNTTLVFPTLTPGQADSFLLKISQDATGNRTLTWPSAKWVAGAVAVVSSAASKVDFFAVFTMSGSSWNVAVVGQDYR